MVEIVERPIDVLQRRWGVETPKAGVPVLRTDIESNIQYACLEMEYEGYAWFKRAMLGIFKLDPRERMPAAEVVGYLPPQMRKSA